MASSNSVSSITSDVNAVANQDISKICTELSKVTVAQNRDMPRCCNTLADMKEPAGKCESGLHVLTPTDAARRVFKSVYRAELQKARLEEKSKTVEFQKDPTALNAVNAPYLETGDISETGSNWASSIGRNRLTMDDTHLGKQFKFKAGGLSFTGKLTGVFDGFGGPKVSQAIRDNITGILTENLERFNMNGLDEKGIYNALRQTMQDLETFAKDDPVLAKAFDKSGSTLNLAMQLGQQIYTANVGDSRASMLTIKDGKGSIQQLTEDQKVSTDVAAGQFRQPIEVKNPDGGYKHNGEPVGYFESRVVKGVGEYFQNRVYGDGRTGIAITRAIGTFKTGDALSCLPKVGKFRLDPDAEHILIQNCDGLHDVATTEDYGQLAFELKSSPEFAASGMSLAEAFLKNAYALGSKDNLTSLTTPAKASKDDVIIKSDAKGVQQAKEYIDKIKTDAGLQI